MDATYWKARCEAAESALQRARSRLWVSPARRRALALLADLRPGEVLATQEVARRLGCSAKAAEVLLRKLEEAGLADRSPRRGCNSAPVLWRLGYLVVVEVEEEGSACS